MEIHNRTDKKYHSNGFIVKGLDSDFAKKYGRYSGIDGDVWPIGKHIRNIASKEVDYLNSYLEEYVYKSDYYNDYVDVCNDIDFMIRYIENCRSAGLIFDILFCQTERNKPECNIKAEKKIDNFCFLGFDYGYPGVNYYSCVYHDVRTKSQMSYLKLNQYSLFDTEEDIFSFIALRDKLKNELPVYAFEQGEFIIYKIWRYVGSIDHLKSLKQP